MRAWIATAGLVAIACKPLEERVTLYGDGWCSPTRTVSASCVIDGDTFDLKDCEAELDSSEDFERIRMLGIQAPELAHPGNEAECYGEEATNYLRWILVGRSIRLEFDVECTGVYGRTLAWVFIEADPDDAIRAELDKFDQLGVEEDGNINLLVNELMIRSGHARLYESEDEGRYYDRLVEAERQAALANTGLWNVCDG
jgi:endonuclease YncB( thermonuclease family)